jgi:hypothetical protein
MAAQVEFRRWLDATSRARPSLLHLPAAIVIVALAVLLGAGIQHRSPTFDEGYHTTRGLAFWWAGDARLSAAHPPLGNALVALPAALALPKVDFSKEPGWDEANRAKVSWAWFSRDYEGARRALMWCRAGMAGLMVLFAIYFYAFCCSFFGRRAALCGLVMLAFNPTLLAQAGVVTTDLPATIGAFVLVGEFARYLRTPRLRQLSTFAIAAGAGMMFKYTVFGIMALILPFWIGWTARRSELGGKGGWRKWRNLLGQAVFVGFVVLLVFNLMYRFSGTGMPIGSMLETFDSPPETGTTFLRFLQALPESTPSPLPRTLVFGLTSVSSHVESGHASYYWGEVGHNGWPSYFPVMLLIKTPLPVLLLLAAALWLGLSPPRRPGVTVTLFLYVCAGFLLMLLPSRMNIGVRHAVPIVPWLTALAGIGASGLWGRLALAGSGGRQFARAVPLLGLLTMPVVALAEFPDYLGYFNGLVGRQYGHRISMIGEDGGQDAMDLAKLVKRRRLTPLYYASYPLSGLELAREGVEATHYRCRGRLPKTPAFFAVHMSSLLRRPECFAFVDWADLRYELNHHIRIYYVDPKRAGRKPKGKRKPEVAPSTWQAHEFEDEDIER